jgi:hypothetical protein
MCRPPGTQILGDPKSRFLVPNFFPQLLLGNGKSDIGSFADYILKNHPICVPVAVAVYYFVLSGVSLSALVADALVKNEIDGLILDTMFKVIRQ